MRGQENDFGRFPNLISGTLDTESRTQQVIDRLKLGVQGMPNYSNAYFDCTIAVSANLIHMLISEIPKELYGWCIDGYMVEDQGWQNLPSKPGLYRCRIRISFSFDDPILTCEECYQTHSVIEKAEVVFDAEARIAQEFDDHNWE